METLLIVAISVLVLVGLVLVGELMAITFLLLTVRGLVARLVTEVSPVATQTRSLLSTLTDTVRTLKTRTSHIAERTAQVTDTVSERVDRTSWLVQQVVSAPLIALLALGRGLQRGARTLRAHRPPPVLPAEGEALVLLPRQERPAA
jgi:hypothetical protein